MSLSLNYPTTGPSLMLDFANSGVLDPRITFTRASTATYFDASGTLQSAATDAPRFDYNPSTLAAQGLLIEEARTNLITSSAALPAGTNATVTPNTYVALDGTTTGDTIVDDTANAEHYSDSSFTPTAATTYTFSAYIKNIGASSSNYAVLRMAGDFSAYVFVQLSDMTVALAGGAGLVANSASVTPANNGWYRVTVSGLSTGTVASVARIQVAQSLSLSAYVGTGVGFAVWGRQLEAGAFPTSYIPTTTTALTRAADVASVNTLSPWFNAVEGTVYAECVLNAFGTTQQTAWRFDDTTDNERMFARRNLSSLQQFVGLDGGAGQWNLETGNTLAVGTPFKHAAAYKVNDIASAFNGGNILTDTAATLPTVTLMRLGGENGGSYLNGYLRRITYYPRRLSNAELVSITS